MSRQIVALSILWISALAAVGRAKEDPPPTADEIMRVVRMSYVNQDSKLTGRLRDTENGADQPFELTMAQQAIRFRFSDPNEIVNLDLSTAPPTLARVVAGSKETVPDTQLSAPIRGMAVSYEDLAMRFLDWPNGKLLKSETVSLAKCWKVHVAAPDNVGSYGSVDLWVHQASGGLAKMEAYDRAGKLIKRFEVRGTQKAGDAMILEKMLMDTVDPASGKKLARIIMSIDKPRKN
jgi:hypothetical protein